MTLVACGATFPLLPTLAADVGIAYTNYLLDASTEKLGIVFPVPKTGNIHKIHFRTGTVTTGDTMKVGLYTVDTAGDPTTTAYGGMVAGTIVLANADDDKSNVCTLGTDAAATVDDLVACVIEFNSYVAGNLNLQSFQAAGLVANRPYLDHFTASWAKSGRIPLLAVEYDDGTFGYIPGVLPFTSGIASQTYNSGSTPDEHALLLSLPVPARICGVAGWVAAAGATSDWDLVLYDSASGTLASQTHPGEDMTGTGTRSGAFHLPRYSLAKSTTYRLSFKPTTANNITVAKCTAPSAAALTQYTGMASVALAYSSRVNAGAWTDDTASILLAALLADQVDDGSSVSNSDGAGIAVVSVPVQIVTVW